ncbi:hypothetical protein NH340_JMT05762 [Sarcoptes scabiei]|nr:hypothetical protein NH340_JMT05762 [Sarcoptes scabiei]
MLKIIFLSLWICSESMTMVRMMTMIKTIDLNLIDLDQNRTLSSSLSSSSFREDLVNFCQQQGDSCQHCIQDIRCFYCHLDNRCYPYTIEFRNECDSKQISWRSCRSSSIDFLIKLAIVFGAISIMVLFITLFWCYCIESCCRRFERRQMKRWEQSRQSLRSIHQQRIRIRSLNQERRSKIREKFHLDSGFSYQHF